MKFLSLLVCLATIGVCEAGAAHPCKAGIREGGCVCMPCKEPSVGAAVLQAPVEPLLLKDGDVLTTMTSRAALGMEFKDGEFTITCAGDYFVRFFAKAHATNAVPESTITIGLYVNGQEVKAKDLTYMSDSSNTQYPALFQGHERFKLSLNVGDKVCLKVDKVTLPDGASAYFVNDSQPGKNKAAGLFLRSGKGAKRGRG